MNHCNYENQQTYMQLGKNNVSATNQLKESSCVRFYNPHGAGKRILFVGNSMTLHGYRPEIGWYGQWGMAASAPEKDYIHRLMAMVNEISNDAAFGIAQVSRWESIYNNGRTVFPVYEEARRFGADVIVMRFVENCPTAYFEKEVFKTEMMALLQYLNGTENAKLILTTGFWRHPADETIIEFATEYALPLVELGDLGEMDEMKAIGLFEHQGVANHPGDMGMKEMAKRIFTALKTFL